MPTSASLNGSILSGEKQTSSWELPQEWLVNLLLILQYVICTAQDTLILALIFNSSTLYGYPSPLLIMEVLVILYWQKFIENSAT